MILKKIYVHKIFDLCRNLEKAKFPRITHEATKVSPSLETFPVILRLLSVSRFSTEKLLLFQLIQSNDTFSYVEND